MSLVLSSNPMVERLICEWSHVGSACCTPHDDITCVCNEKIFNGTVDILQKYSYVYFNLIKKKIFGCHLELFFLTVEGYRIFLLIRKGEGSLTTAKVKNTVHIIFITNH